jgi:hypothetical protein
MKNFYSSGKRLRFYLKGYEVDVQDPTFFMDENIYYELKETIEEMLTTYGQNLQMA